MKTFVERVRRFLVSEEGPAAVEYAVMLALIIVGCLTAISSIGAAAKGTFTSISKSLGKS